MQRCGRGHGSAATASQQLRRGARHLHGVETKGGSRPRRPLLCIDASADLCTHRRVEKRSEADDRRRRRHGLAIAHSHRCDAQEAAPTRKHTHAFAQRRRCRETTTRTRRQQSQGPRHGTGQVEGPRGVVPHLASIVWSTLKEPHLWRIEAGSSPTRPSTASPSPACVRRHSTRIAHNGLQAALEPLKRGAQRRG